MNGIITTDQVVHAVRVLVDGEVVASFDEISDDYAFTHRDEFVRALKRELPTASKLIDATNKAWSQL